MLTSSLAEAAPACLKTLNTQGTLANDGQRWSVTGWSTGGYCAALRHLREPTPFGAAAFGAAASVEGYFSLEPDSGTSNLSYAFPALPGHGSWRTSRSG